MILTVRDRRHKLDAAEDSVPGKLYVVVVNDEEQYSIWWAGREIPAGWRTLGIEGNKQDCLDWIDVNWTDMRPLSLRRSMDEAAAASQSDATGRP
jgi:MbtH protein